MIKLTPSVSYINFSFLFISQTPCPTETRMKFNSFIPPLRTQRSLVVRVLSLCSGDPWCSVVPNSIPPHCIAAELLENLAIPVCQQISKSLPGTNRIISRINCRLLLSQRETSQQLQCQMLIQMFQLQNTK